MRIAVNTFSIVPGKVGGTETFLVNLLENLVRLDNGNQFLFVVSRNNRELFCFDSENVEYLEFRFDNTSRQKRAFVEQFVLPIELKRKINVPGEALISDADGAATLAAALAPYPDSA